MKHWLIVDRVEDWLQDIPGVEVVTATDFLTAAPEESAQSVRVYNLCRSTRYQSNGYYVSLLASARGFAVVPDIATVQDLKSPTVARLIGSDETALIQESLKRLQGDQFVLSIYFGQGLARRHARLARALFNRCPSPMLRAKFSCRADGWQLDKLSALALDEVSDDHRAFLGNAAADWFGKRRQSARRRRDQIHDLAILVNPKEPDAPSNEKALKNFEKAAAKAGFNVSRIGKDDQAEIPAFDALFIRETTAVNHHTYRFARRAALEGLVVIDDPDSILRCTNKVYLAERLARSGIATPQTIVVHKGNLKDLPEKLGFPIVLKQPDSAFSRGVVRVADKAGLQAEASRLLKVSDLLVAQGFVGTDYDWRVGVLNGQPLYVCRYFMAPQHWQIVQHQSDGGKNEGDAETLAVEEAPPGLIRVAVRAANAIGRGLYGVDIKQVGRRFLVIEVNDNPNVDAGIEDAVLGPVLYQRVMEELCRRVEAHKRG